MDIKKIGINALKKSYETIDRLGESGKNKIKSNLHGEMSLLADIESEKAIINILEKEKIPIKIVSEEHGILYIGGESEFLGVLDGIDGTKEYEEKGKGGRYGTMFAIFSGTNPKYADYLFSGIMEHPRDTLYYTVKNSGSFMINGASEKKIRASNRKIWDENTIIHCYKDVLARFNVDGDYKTLTSKLGNCSFIDEYAAQTKYIDIASGKADLSLEFTRKGNLELAVGFGIVKEAGGGG